MEARFKTNLDQAQRFVDALSGRDFDANDYHHGDLVEFTIDHSIGAKLDRRSFQLEVVARTHHPTAGYVLIELHLPRHWTQSIREWEQWFKRHVLNRE